MTPLKWGHLSNFLFPQKQYLLYTLPNMDEQYCCLDFRHTETLPKPTGTTTCCAELREQLGTQWKFQYRKLPAFLLPRAVTKHARKTPITALLPHFTRHTHTHILRTMPIPNTPVYFEIHCIIKYVEKSYIHTYEARIAFLGPQHSKVCT